MDRRPIGIFDSGLGGLTAVRELTALLPGEDIIYFGDTSRVPYGSRSRDTIIQYARQDVAFLRSFDLKAILIACNTVSSTAMEVLEAENSIPMIGVVAPSVQAAVQSSRNGVIGLIGTQATIRTGIYIRRIKALRPDAEIVDVACPLFVPLAENGRVEPGDIVVETVAREYLAPIKQAGADTLVLGCTHYPLLQRVIANEMGPQVTLVNSGAEGARAVRRRLMERDALNDPGHTGVCRYYVSDSVGSFVNLASVFLGHDVTGEVARVDITRY